MNQWGSGIGMGEEQAEDGLIIRPKDIERTTPQYATGTAFLKGGDHARVDSFPFYEMSESVLSSSTMSSMSRTNSDSSSSTTSITSPLSSGGLIMGSVLAK